MASSKSSDGAVVLALFLIGHAAVIERLGVVGIDLDRLIVVPDGAVVLALAGVGVATVVVGDSEESRLSPA